MHQRGAKVRDQEVGNILEYNPSDCSHWKRGEKNVRSIFALANLSETLGVEVSLIHDVASGAIDLDEAFYEYLESKNYKNLLSEQSGIGRDEEKAVRQKVLPFVEKLQAECEFSAPPLYLPEVMRAFAFVSTQPVEMMDKLSRILRVKAGKYCIQFKKGDLRPQTRMSMVMDLARIIFEGERNRFPELGAAHNPTLALEEMLFTVNLLVPKGMLAGEIAKLDSRRNLVSELAALFWVPKSLICFQMQDILRDGVRPIVPAGAKTDENTLQPQVGSF